MSFAPINPGVPKVPGMVVADGGGIVARPKPPKYACDGDGWTAKPNIPDPTKPMDSAKGMKVLGATILLVGGALLGYGHKEHISKGLDTAKGAIQKFFSTGTPASLLAKGKELLAKGKDLIMAK